MYARLLQPPKGSFFLLGPRGSGKTTWLKEHFSAEPWIDLLDEGRYQRYLADAAALGRELNAMPRGARVVIDEIQRLPALLNEVHRAIEGRKLKFALSGSSARKLRRGGVNLLAGRAVFRTMFPLAPLELGEDFDLDRALRIGTLPVVWSAEDPEDTLDAYSRLYLKEEIQAEALVRNLPGFARFLPVSALFHGQTLNASALARDAAVSRTTVLDYLTILEDTLLAARLPAYEGALRVREKKHPKLYWIDPGLVRSLKGARGPLAADERGPLFEGLVLMLLRLYRDLPGTSSYDLFYWAPGEAKLTEVDFLLVAGKDKVAIEVKVSSRLREEHFNGLRAIGDLKGLRRRLLLSPSAERGRTADGIEVMDLAAFSEELHQGELI